MTLLGTGGEEWRNLEGAHGNYQREHWRDVLDRANDQITRQRQRDVTLQVQRHDGRPVAGQDIDILQVEPAFIWGNCMWPWQEQLAQGKPLSDYERLQRHFQRRIFNSCNLLHYWTEKHAPNAPASERVQGYLNYEHLDGMVNYCLGLGLTCKGHPLYWTVPKALPLWLLEYDHKTQWKFLEVRIRSLVARFRGRIKLYDAVNEMMWEPLLANIAQRHWPHIEPISGWADDIEQLLGWARDEDPDAIYLLNEYGLGMDNHKPCPIPSSDGSTVTPESQCRRMLDLVQTLQRRGAAPDGIGLQTPPGDWGYLESFDKTITFLGGNTGLPVYMTELRIGTQELKKAGLSAEQIDLKLADYIEDLFTVAYGNPHMAGFYIWGDWDLSVGREPPVLYRRLYSLIRERWVTRTTVRTDAEGRANFRGFQGEYRARLTSAGGQTTGYAFQVPAPQTTPLSVELAIRG